MIWGNRPRVNVSRPNGIDSLRGTSDANGRIGSPHPLLLGGIVVLIEVRTARDLVRRTDVLLEEYNFKREVLDDPGPVLVDFWAQWCPPCRAMNPVLGALARDFKVCKVNTDTNPALAGKFGVSAIPLLLVFHHGEVVRRYEGVTPEATLRADLEALARG
jgi:thioredoxin 1